MEQVQQFLQYVPPVERAISASGTILVKYWLEVSPENQTMRLEERMEEYVRIWKLTSMDLESYSKWFDYSRARDDMFAVTDTPENPWYVVDANDQRRARLNCISHLLSIIPYEEVPHARSGDPAMISGYMGKTDVFDQAIENFAVAYADQTERDHAALMNAVRSGRIEVIIE